MLSRLLFKKKWGGNHDKKRPINLSIVSDYYFVNYF